MSESVLVSWKVHHVCCESAIFLTGSAALCISPSYGRFGQGIPNMMSMGTTVPTNIFPHWQHHTGSYGINTNNIWVTLIFRQKLYRKTGFDHRGYFCPTTYMLLIHPWCDYIISCVILAIRTRPSPFFLKSLLLPARWLVARGRASWQEILGLWGRGMVALQQLIALKSESSNI